MLSRRGLHRLRYHALHVRRAHLLTMRATTELSDQHATLELIGGLQMSSDEGLLPGCFQRADSASWLTNKSAMLAATTTSSTLSDRRRTPRDVTDFFQGGADPNDDDDEDGHGCANRPRRM